ncbi:IS5 family transposase [Corynebacterium yudongzhengii]|uniref:IS5 family transposase n=1 Tax=Corynebacterium yudongzhengii TaxID=2080740 RepID=UPI001F334D21|nr:IS5 family transposase [Corynebacterium yudongzhengii]
MSRFQLLTDAQWEMVADLLPRRTGRKVRPFSDPRQMLEGILYRLRVGIPWRDLPDCFGSWQTVYTWHNRMARDGTWNVILERMIAQADAEGLIDWSVSVDSTINRAHQHATNITRVTGGFVELQQPPGRAA